MKRLLPLMLLVIVSTTPAFCQLGDTSFIKQWKIIDSLMSDAQLPKTALQKVNYIYGQAKQKNLEAQVIKALLYKIALTAKNTEDNIDSTYNTLYNETSATKNVLKKSILQVLLADNLQNYLNNNYWRINNRTQTKNIKKGSIETWSTQDVLSAIDSLYREALQPALLLQQTPISAYSALIIDGDASALRPTMYDLLAVRALGFYDVYGERQTKPADAFTLKDSITLADAVTFSRHNFIAADTASFLLKELQLYQQLLQFHIVRNDTAALIDFDLTRIEWANIHAVFKNKEESHKKALQSLTVKYPVAPATAQAWYLLIKQQADAADAAGANDPAHRYDLVNIRQQILQRLAAQPAESEGNTNMKTMLQGIEQKTLTTKAEAVNVPGLPFRVLVQYKNVDTLYGRILSQKAVDAVLAKNDSTQWQEIARLPHSVAFTQPLPSLNDYRQHSVEIKMDALQPGEYVLFASSTKSFTDSVSRLLRQDIFVSHLTYIHKGNDYYVLDRETGKPLAGIKVEAWLSPYETNGKKTRDNTLFDGATGVDGHFSLINTKQSGRLTIKLTDGKDVYQNAGNDQYYYSNDNEQAVVIADYEKTQARLDLFTDRAIYRPGQKVFFKGIAVTDDKTMHTPKLYLMKDSIRIYLRDVNLKIIDSLNLRLNEYGSLAGSFTLPAHALTGMFAINAKDIQGNMYFNVEEYKRPTFYVKLDTLANAYRLNDTITVTGFAQAFAGNFLNGAKVKYNVTRNTRYNIFDWGFKRYPNTNNGQHIDDGTVTTDATGKFTIQFIALPDESADSSTNPVFDFNISTAVTDAGGETRESNTSVSLGFSSLAMKIDVPETQAKQAFNKIAVNVQNLSGKPVNAIVHITVRPLQSPSRTVRRRYWEEPDEFVMTETDFIKNFPYDEYKSETNYAFWQRGNAIVNDSFNTAVTNIYNLQKSPLPQGRYIIEATTVDKDGRTVKEEAYTELYDPATSDMPTTQEEFIAVDKEVLYPGDTAQLFIGTGFKDVHVFTQVDKLGTNTQQLSKQPPVLNLGNNKKTVGLIVSESERGGFGIYYSFVVHNRFYSGGKAFSVPYNNKDLEVRYTTFRNKTEPGSKEQWTIKVKRSDSSNATAELLTTMYDASLDAFTNSSWVVPVHWPQYEGANNWQEDGRFRSNNADENDQRDSDFYFYKEYPRLVASAGELVYNDIMAQEGLNDVKIGTINQNGGREDVVMAAAPMFKRNGDAAMDYNKDMTEPKHMKLANVAVEDKLAGNINDRINDISFRSDTIKLNTKTQRTRDEGQSISPSLRTNFNETAFFFPQLYPDSTGNYTISFTMPESLTQWKWMSLAHTKDLAFGMNEGYITTQKTLMVQPNIPRFLREGDALELTARISNTGDTALTGQAELQLIDPQTGKPVDGLFHNVFPNQYFTAEAGQTTVVKFPVEIPFNYTRPLTYRIVASTASFNDGEENTLPVLTNRMLVTESLPLYVKGDTTKQFTFTKLLNNQSETLQTQSLTVEYTANPVWNAIQALPYLMEYPYECAEQTFNRFYANALAAYIVQQHPRIKQVFDAWAASPKGGGLEGAALLSNLEKNQELKQVLLEETPWVLDAQNETQQMKNIALLFDVVRMADEAKGALQKLQDMQTSDGAFPWFKGGYADRYITQYILTGIGRLQQLHPVPQQNSTALNTVVTRALGYLDNAANTEYQWLVKNKVTLTKDNLSETAIQYLYMRSYFTTMPVANKTAYNYYYQQAMQFWQSRSEYMKGMIAMTLTRTNQLAFVQRSIYPSIVENAVTTAEKGMCWKNNTWGYYWYQSPIEQQALLIELANAVDKKADADEMRTWLINQKQTNNWQTTKATADACFALVLNNSTMIEANRNVSIALGDHTFNNNTSQAGTGYFKKVLPGDSVTNAMGGITVTVTTPAANTKNISPSYGAVYWKYFEDMDKITQATTSLSLHKKLFVQRNSSAGTILTPVDADSVLHVGDKVVMRIELTTDRSLEYVHLKDMRAATMEPVNVLSEYKWQDGLGYYESTKDVATDFFIDHMAKGTYVFEYPVYITHVGTFSAGIATIQCMYAPEFSSHSEGVKVTVE